jgi:hypothetical protein
MGESDPIPILGKALGSFLIVEDRFRQIAL